MSYFSSKPYITFLGRENELFMMFTIVSGIINSLKHSSNLILFYALNIKFRNGLNRFIPFLNKKTYHSSALTSRFQKSNKIK